MATSTVGYVGGLLIGLSLFIRVVYCAASTTGCPEGQSLVGHTCCSNQKCGAGEQLACAGDNTNKSLCETCPDDSFRPPHAVTDVTEPDRCHQKRSCDRPNMIYKDNGSTVKDAVCGCKDGYVLDMECMPINADDITSRVPKTLPTPTPPSGSPAHPSKRTVALASMALVLFVLAALIVIGYVSHKRGWFRRRRGGAPVRNVHMNGSTVKYIPIIEWSTWPKVKRDQARNLMIEKVYCNLSVQNFEKLVRQLFPGQGNKAESIIEDGKGSQVRERIRAAVREWINRNESPEILTAALRNIDENRLAELIDSELTRLNEWDTHII